MTMVEIKPADEKVTSVKCKPGEEVSFKFVLSNKSESTNKIGFDLQFEDEESEVGDWINVKQELNLKQYERDLKAAGHSAKGDMSTITIDIKPPQNLLGEEDNLKEYEFALRVYNRDDYSAVQSDKILITVERPITDKGFLKKLFGGKKSKEK